MTTLLFDPVEKALYADSLTNIGGSVYSSTHRKIKQIHIKGLGYCLVASSGCVEAAFIAEDIFEGDESIKPDEDDISMIVLDKTGKAYEIFSAKSMTPRHLGNRPIYHGSGWLIAKSAHEATNNPAKAMHVAKSLDIYSGGKTMKASYVNGIAVFEYFD